MFFVAVGTDHQPKNLKCGGCTWYEPAEIYTYVRYVPGTYAPGISRLPRYVVYDTRYVDTSILVPGTYVLASPVAEPTTAAAVPPPPPPLLLLLLLLLLCRYSLLRAFLKTQNEKQQSVVTVCAPRCIAGREAAAGQ